MVLTVNVLLVVASVIIVWLALVEDSNKPLDEGEKYDCWAY